MVTNVSIIFAIFIVLAILVTTASVMGIAVKVSQRLRLSNARKKRALRIETEQRSFSAIDVEAASGGIDQVTLRLHPNRRPPSIQEGQHVGDIDGFPERTVRLSHAGPTDTEETIDHHLPAASLSARVSRGSQVGSSELELHPIIRQHHRALSERLQDMEREVASLQALSESRRNTITSQDVEVPASPIPPVPSLPAPPLTAVTGFGPRPERDSEVRILEARITELQAEMDEMKREMQRMNVALLNEINPPSYEPRRSDVETPG